MNKPNCCEKCFVPKEYGGLQPIPDCFDAACPCHAPMNKPNCCEKCRTSPNIIPGVKAELERLGPHGCWLDNCTCHIAPTNKETTPEWEGGRLHAILNNSLSRKLTRTEYKSVIEGIQSLLATATAEAYKRGIESTSEERDAFYEDAARRGSGE